MFKIKTQKVLSEQNIKRIIAMGISLKDSVDSIEQGLIEEYDSSKTYVPNMACYYNDYLYRCLFTTTGEFDINSWKKVGDSLELVNKAQVEAMLGLTPDELQTLSSIILDSEIRLDKTHSSSKIFSDMQDILSQSKKFTLEEFAKANKASYHVVSATSEMTDKSVIYLMSNNTNYDMYIVESDGTPTKIGDTTIDLSQYAKLSDLDNYYDKATSDGKYATITTVSNHINDTVAHMTQSEKDSYALKSSITDTINSSSTSTDIASAKGVYDNAIKNKNLKTYTDISQLGLTIPTTVENIFKNMPDNSLLCQMVDNYSITNVPYGNGILIIHKRRDSKFSIEFKISAGMSVAQNYLYIGQLKGSDVSGLTWSRVCTTSIADVDWNSANTTSVLSKGMIKYRVKNGVCFVSVIDIISATMSTKDQIIATGLPIPEIGLTSVNSWFVVGSSLTGGQPLLVKIKPDGSVMNFTGDDNVGYFGTFSYPVAE